MNSEKEVKRKKLWIETYERQVKHFQEREQHFLEEAGKQDFAWQKERSLGFAKDMKDKKEIAQMGLEVAQEGEK